MQLFVVVDVDNVNLFKTRLDRFRANQDVRYMILPPTYTETDQRIKYVKCSVDFLGPTIIVYNALQKAHDLLPLA